MSNRKRKQTWEDSLESESAMAMKKDKIGYQLSISYHSTIDISSKDVGEPQAGDGC